MYQKGVPGGSDCKESACNARDSGLIPGLGRSGECIKSIQLVWASAFVCCLNAKSCPSLSHPLNSSPLGSFVHGISQARTLEWVAISFSKGYSRLRDRTRVSGVSCIDRLILYHWYHPGSSHKCLYGSPISLQMGVQASSGDSVPVSFRYTSRSWTSSPYKRSIPSSLRNLFTVVLNDCISLYSP